MRLGTDLEGRAIIALNGRKDRCSLNIGELEDGSFSVWFRERGGDAGASLALRADGMAELRLHGREGKGSLQLLGAPGMGHHSY